MKPQFSLIALFVIPLLISGCAVENTSPTSTCKSEVQSKAKKYWRDIWQTWRIEGSEFSKIIVNVGESDISGISITGTYRLVLADTKLVTGGGTWETTGTYSCKLDTGEVDFTSGDFLLHPN
jgi:hypothetical protein